MINDKRKILAVIGESESRALVALIESFHLKFDVEIVTFVDSKAIDHVKYSKVKLIERNLDLPDYMKGLEDLVRNADLVVCDGSEMFSSFQSLRAARKLNIPHACFLRRSSRELLDSDLQQRSIHFDIINYSNLIITSYKRLSYQLAQEGVLSSKVCPMVWVDSKSSFELRRTKRAKMRKYLGVTDQTKLINVFVDTSDSQRVLDILRSFKLADKNEGFSSGNTKLMIIDEKAITQDLKYKSQSMGYGSSLMFLGQETGDIMTDLISAGDLIVYDRHLPRQTLPELVFDIKGHASSGRTIVVRPESVISEELSQSEITEILDYNAVASHSKLKELMKFSRSVNDPTTNPVELSSDWSILFERVLQLAHEKPKSDASIDIESLLFELAEAKNTDSITSVLVKAEEILLTEVKESPVYSKLLSLMGSKYSEIGNDNVAMTKFEEAIKLDEKDHAAISGSGMIHVKQQNIEVAVSCFRRSLALQPNCSQSLIGMGMVYRKIKLGSESIYWFKRAVDQLGSNSIATKHLVQTCLEFCTVPSSVEALESLLEEDSENDIIKKALIKVYDEQGRWKQSMNLSQPA